MSESAGLHAWERRREGRPVPRSGEPALPGHEYIVTTMDVLHWRLASGKRCRWGAGFHMKACGRPCVAELNRSSFKGRKNWWAYCELHLYGRWIEDGQVLMWIMVKKTDQQETR